MKHVYSTKDWQKPPKKNPLGDVLIAFGRKVHDFYRHHFARLLTKKSIAEPRVREWSAASDQDSAQEDLTNTSPMARLKKTVRRLRRGTRRRSSPHAKGSFKSYAMLGLKIAGVLAGIGLIFIIGIFIYFAKDLPEIGKVNSRFVAESTKIYDRTGEILLYDIHGEEKRTIIPGSEIPETIKHATIALEDQDFYEHHGIKFTSIIRAALSQVFGVGVRSGGSTITQQLIKNSILTSERSITRKIKEAILAIELEFTATKEEILELYLNEIPYGSNAYGIEAAAKTFFDKSARDLTYDEAAILASLPQAPSRYSPYGLNQELLKGRQERAIDQMQSLGFITQAQAEEYKAVDVLGKVAKNRENINAPHFVFYIRDYLEEKYGAEYLEKNGLTITTTLDWEKQQIAERIVKEKALENKEKFNAENASLVAIDSDTGEVIAMVGSRDYFDEEIDGQVNVALAKRQPGSSFKPYVFLQSFVEGYTPESILFDVETAFPIDRAPDYEPQNYDGTFRGPVKIKEALALSLNIPAVKALYLVGMNDVLDFTSSLGITTLTDPDRYGLSLVLGGGEVTLLDHTAAFSVFSNGGVRKDKAGILKVTDRDGAILEELTQSDGERVVEQEHVNMLSHILSTNEYRIPAFGTNSPLKFDDRPVAAKTGTTNENRDAWTMGYTPEVAVGVWSGNNDNSPMTDKGVGANVAAPIFRAFIEEAYPDSSDQSFASYDKDDVKTGKDILDGDIPEFKKIDVCEISKRDEEYCRENKYCPDNRKKERAFVNIHNILHFVKKDDPRGDAPSSPKDDPFYKNWEEGVQDFYKDQDDVIFADEPRSCKADDFKSEKPKISLKLKADGDVLDIEVDTDAPFDTESYTYYINDKEVESFKGSRYRYDVPQDQNDQELDVRVKYRDEAGNEATATGKVRVVY